MQHPARVSYHCTNANQHLSGSSRAVRHGQGHPPREGTTQGDPLVMAMYSLVVVPLLRSIRTARAAQVWFAGDVSVSGYLDSLRQWWDALVDKGPAYGYFPNAQKNVAGCKTALRRQGPDIF